MSLKREKEAEKELNSYLFYKDKFDFHKFCNSFKFQNNSIFRIILKTGDILSTRMMFLENLYSFNVDALIVQDLGLAWIIKKEFPDFELHASTQMTINNY